MEEFRSQKIKGVLKGLLKKQNITYEELGKKLECSVPTVKRILGQEEISLNRLLQICDILDLDLSELGTLANTKEEKEESFTEAQEMFLAKNSHYFSYLLKLFAGETPRQIATEYNLTQRSTDKYLINLEKHGLIHVTGSQKVKPAFKVIPHLGRGVLAKTHFENMIRESAHFFTGYIHSELISQVPLKDRISGKYAVFAHRVTKETYKNWVEARNKALKDFENMARFEEKTKDESELMTAVVVEANALVANDHKGIKSLDNTFGEIVNL